MEKAGAAYVDKYSFFIMKRKQKRRCLDCMESCILHSRSDTKFNGVTVKIFRRSYTISHTNHDSKLTELEQELFVV